MKLAPPIKKNPINNIFYKLSETAGDYFLDAHNSDGASLLSAALPTGF